MIDRIVTAARWDRLPPYAAGLLLVFTLQAAIALANTLVVGRVGQGVVRDLRHQLYERLQRLGLAYYDRTPTGAIIARLMDDVGAISTFVTGQTFTILTDLGHHRRHRRPAGRTQRAARPGRARLRAALCPELPLLHAEDPRHQQGRASQDGRPLRPPEGEARRRPGHPGPRPGAGRGDRVRRRAR